MKKKNLIGKKNPFEQFGKGESLKPIEIQKSDIFDAMREGYHGQITMNKSGIEIKSQIRDNLLPKLTSAFEEKSAKLNELLGKTGAAPTRPVYYYKVKLDLPYKEYEWCETKYKVDSKTVLFDNFANVVEGDSESEGIEVKEKVEEFNCPKSLEEAKARIEYNDVLRGLLEVAVDIKTANVLLNLSDDQTYALTTEQMLALGW